MIVAKVSWDLKGKVNLYAWLNWNKQNRCSIITQQLCQFSNNFCKNVWNRQENTAWKVSKYGVFLVHIFLYLDWTRRFTVNLSVQSKYRKIRTRKNSVFGYFSWSECSKNRRKSSAISDNQCIPHQSSWAGNDHERKMNYDWPKYVTQLAISIYTYIIFSF